MPSGCGAICVQCTEAEGPDSGTRKRNQTGRTTAVLNSCREDIPCMVTSRGHKPLSYKTDRTKSRPLLLTSLVKVLPRSFCLRKRMIVATRCKPWLTKIIQQNTCMRTEVFPSSYPNQQQLCTVCASQVVGFCHHAVAQVHNVTHE